ncbi:tRNA 2-selenouridine(34) synthase MnmH [Bacillus carboniphilus]|uniref:tRNA 2-selenouridine(34) synthase MnmH n=1 Tax=Bacillus carboniphilus TaxID=86663 RepID=A0ABP3FXD2_9BACI
MKECSLKDYLENKQKYIPIDIRSPIEFEEGHIFGAVNIPLFTNEERAQVGTTYKQKGKENAQWLGMKLVAPKIPTLLEEIKKHTNIEKLPLVYCFRGGLRSKSMAQFCNMAALPVTRLIGGYKEYRNYIVDKTEELLPTNAFVLHGLTGSGKTEILQNLTQRGLPVLDLESYAGHKGSLFGHIGQTVHTQKMFDAYLYQALENIQPHSYIIMEAESKRIGKSVQPDRLMELKQTATHIMITCSNENRVKRIVEEYILPYEQEEWFVETFEEILTILWKRMRGAPYWKEIKDSWDQRMYNQFVALLLEHYYDPKYIYKQKEYNQEGVLYSVDSDDIESAANDILNIIENNTIKTPI